MSVDRPLVTVVTASFRALEDLRQTVESVAAQGLDCVEHVVIDGGSDDGTREYLQSCDNVRWVSEPDEGIADALNKGVAMARGEWIIVLQAGDLFFDDTTLERAMRHLGEGYEIVSFDVILQEADSERLLRAKGFGTTFSFFMSMPHQGAFCRRDLLERCGGFDPTCAVALDYDFYFRAREAGVGVRVVNEPLSLMPVGGISTRTDWPSVRRRLAEARKLHFRYARNAAETAIYAAFWTLYLPYKWFRMNLAR
ncbi:glycosyltransferase family 2 protein [Aurantiacibacter hainanensis]|uniref:glycosyltransferase family 2 protein n=1 Tax=Aurantiacibacter hainanensis TaxID=3076114 RepID=UPI0030C6F2A4